MCVIVALLLVGYVVFGHGFSSWKHIIRRHWMLPRKDEVKEWERAACLLCGFHKHDEERWSLITGLTPPLDLDDTFPVITGNDRYRL